MFFVSTYLLKCERRKDEVHKGDRVYVRINVSLLKQGKEREGGIENTTHHTTHSRAVHSAID